jgi:hypothetical protein
MQAREELDWAGLSPLPRRVGRARATKRPPSPRTGKGAGTAARQPHLGLPCGTSRRPQPRYHGGIGLAHGVGRQHQPTLAEPVADNVTHKTPDRTGEPPQTGLSSIPVVPLDVQPSKCGVSDRRFTARGGAACALRPGRAFALGAANEGDQFVWLPCIGRRCCRGRCRHPRCTCHVTCCRHGLRRLASRRWSR